MKEKHSERSRNQVVWGRIAEEFVQYRLQLTSKGVIRKKHKLYYDLIHIYGNLEGYHERKIEVKACQLFYQNGKENQYSTGSFKIYPHNHKKILLDDGLYIFVYMFHEKVLFAISYNAKDVDKLPSKHFLIKGRNNKKYFNVRANFFANKEIQCI